MSYGRRNMYDLYEKIVLKTYIFLEKLIMYLKNDKHV